MGSLGILLLSSSRSSLRSPPLSCLSRFTLYLKTQQAADDLRRQMEVKETESNHIHSQVSMEISLVQNQFQEQLQLLSSIPDAVNKLQLQVQEEEQQWCMAEFRRRELMHELYDAKQQMDCYTKEINEIQVRLQQSKDEQKELHKQLKNCEKENEELQNEVSALKILLHLSNAIQRLDTLIYSIELTV
ncbi:coiled-coil domain-containing protein 18-like [Schistocerca serialis cubense]|uniref:coiled-coil domain-containing protein 18-like n=1 Tax=Schistocerca serialis cubense TaxID=2023355 RepID=UPI00214E8E44|nr:coiled-coil domain-containing protein 18-like [Schistocerca serialis cubense]